MIKYLPPPNTTQLSNDSFVKCVSSSIVIKLDLISLPGVLSIGILSNFHVSDNYSEKIWLDECLLHVNEDFIFNYTE